MDRANRLRTSVSDTTPVSRPDRWAPGNAAAGTEEKLWPGRGDCWGADTAPGVGTSTVDEVRGDISGGPPGVGADADAGVAPLPLELD